MAQIDQALVDRLYRQANAGRWQLPVDRFARALEASAAKAFAGGTPRLGSGQATSARDLERYLESLRLEDLALACACAEGHEAAWDHFVLEYRPVLYRAADAMDPGGGARELADSLYADLYGLQIDPVRLKLDTTSVGVDPVRLKPDTTSAGERRSLFRYFHGRSSLATWLRAVLAQRQVDRARAAARTAPLPDEEPATPTPHAPDPDRGRYLALIHAAFRDAVARLDPRDRLRLLYYYAQGLTLAQAGRLLREHEASVSRHLSAARKTIRRDVEGRLREAGLDPDEIARCFEYVTEDAGPLDLDRLLADTAFTAAAVRESGPPSQHRPAGSQSDPISAKAARNSQPDVQREGPSWDGKSVTP
jgi:RNA polymerase sigma factor (sigma-70 family)